MEPKLRWRGIDGTENTTLSDPPEKWSHKGKPLPIKDIKAIITQLGLQVVEIFEKPLMEEVELNFGFEHVLRTSLTDGETIIINPQHHSRVLMFAVTSLYLYLKDMFSDDYFRIERVRNSHN